jgi:glycosyltransferase involved in cell wall biosynthesis
MKVVIAHPSLNRGGGAEKVCLTAIKALIRRDYRVKLVTVERTNWRFLEGRFGRLCRPSEEVYVMERMPIRGKSSQAVFTLMFFLAELVFYWIRSKDAVVLNTYGDLVDSLADVSYINALPVRVTYRYPEYGFSDSIIWRTIVQAYSFCLRAIEKLFRSNVLLTNSTYMQIILRKCLRQDSFVVFPPVDVKRFSNIEHADRKNIVVAVSRFRVGKNLTFIPRLATHVKNVDFVIFGLADQASQDSIIELRREIKDLGVKNRVRILINQPFHSLVNVLASSKVFLNTQFMEGFGIAVVEAMAAGCVPIVPRDGGPWFDILEQRQGDYGFSYESVGEAAQLIERIIVDEELRKSVSTRACERAMIFDTSIFERKILSVIESACLSKFK